MPPMRHPVQGSPDWGRVVGVIVQGVKWQFKDWPFKVSSLSVHILIGSSQGGAQFSLCMQKDRGRAHLCLRLQGDAPGPVSVGSNSSRLRRATIERGRAPASKASLCGKEAHSSQQQSSTSELHFPWGHIGSLDLPKQPPIHLSNPA